MVIVSNSDKLFSNDHISEYGFVCDLMQSQTPTIYLSIPDNQAFGIDTLSIKWNNLHAYTFPLTIMISSFSLNPLISVQNSYYNSSLTSILLVLIDVISTSISSDSTSVLSKLY